MGEHVTGAYLEVWRAEGPQAVPLSSERLTIGKAPSNDVAVGGDRLVSRLHASLERYRAGWCVRDLASRNGTFVNGERIWAERPLRHGDEIRVGKTRLVFRTEAIEGMTVTEAGAVAPLITPRERDVLLALCRPVLSGDVFTEPASIREIAEHLVVTEGAVKQHLLRLYEKFGVPDEGERRRVRLANEAIRRGSISIADLRSDPRE
jgi:DNA-binding transcriptional ArsR family regulator